MCLFKRLYSHNSRVCAREWQIRQWDRNVHSKVECLGLGQLINWIAWRKRVSSFVDRTRWRAVMDILCVLSNSKTRLMMSSSVLPVRSTTVKVVHRGFSKSCKKCLCDIFRYRKTCQLMS